MVGNGQSCYITVFPSTISRYAGVRIPSGPASHQGIYRLRLCYKEIFSIEPPLTSHLDTCPGYDFNRIVTSRFDVNHSQYSYGSSSVVLVDTSKLLSPDNATSVNNSHPHSNINKSSSSR